MISEIPKDKFDITIFILERRGGFLKSIPNYINIKFYDEYENINEYRIIVVIKYDYNVLPR